MEAQLQGTKLHGILASLFEENTLSPPALDIVEPCLLVYLLDRKFYQNSVFPVLKPQAVCLRATRATGV